MKKLSYLLQELTEKTAVVSFGRFSPPHIGHSKLVDFVVRQPRDHFVFVSHTQDNKKNPLSADDKIYILSTAHPEHSHIFRPSSEEEPDIFHKVKALNTHGYTHLHVVVGEDRVDEFTNKLNKYNGTDYNYKSIKVSSCGERDPDSNDTEGASSSKMREYAKDANLEKFTEGLHPNLKPHAVSIMGKVRKGIGLEEDVDFIRERFIRGEIFNVGDLVEATGLGIAEIINRGTNYVTIIHEGKEYRKWLSDIIPSSARPTKPVSMYKGVVTIKGYKAKNISKELSEQFSKAYKESKDKYAVFSLLVCLDKLIGASETDIRENFDHYKVQYERMNKYLNKIEFSLNEVYSCVEDMLIEEAVKQGKSINISSKEKIANIIRAATLADVKNNDPCTMINESVRHVTHTRYSSQGWKILGCMLNIATSSGIEWDKSQLHTTTKQFIGIK